MDSEFPPFIWRPLEPAFDDEVQPPEQCLSDDDLLVAMKTKRAASISGFGRLTTVALSFCAVGLILACVSQIRYLPMHIFQCMVCSPQDESLQDESLSAESKFDTSKKQLQDLVQGMVDATKKGLWKEKGWFLLKSETDESVQISPAEEGSWRLIFKGVEIVVPGDTSTKEAIDFILRNPYWNEIVCEREMTAKNFAGFASDPHIAPGHRTCIGYVKNSDYLQIQHIVIREDAPIFQFFLDIFDLPATKKDKVSISIDNTTLEYNSEEGILTKRIGERTTETFQVHNDKKRIDLWTIAGKFKEAFPKIEVISIAEADRREERLDSRMLTCSLTPGLQVMMNWEKETYFVVPNSSKKILLRSAAEAA